MPFPEHIERIFEAYGVPSDTKAALYDLYVSMGEEVLGVFGDIAESVASPASLRPEHCVTIRHQVVERYLTRNHPKWLQGMPTPSLYHPRVLEGRASGAAIPLGTIHPSVEALLDEGQRVPDGMLVQGRNAHFGGRQETISFDLIASSLEDAMALGIAEGQQHTLPGSAGETSGTLDPANQVALLWEVQPNVYKPAGERNRGIAKVYRRHRNWHVITLVSALQWLRSKSFRIFIIKGEALAAAHEVNPGKPVSGTIVELHNRTVEKVIEGLDLELASASRDDEQVLVNSTVMNTGLQKHVGTFGAAGAIWRVGENSV